MSPRERILGRLRAAAPATPRPLPALTPVSGATISGDTLPAALKTFVGALEAAHAEVVDARNQPVAALLDNFCQAKGIRRLLVPGGFEQPVQGAGIVVERFDRPVESFKNALFKEIDAGLTVADCGLADTGVLIQRSTAVQPRTLSLVPPIHFCLFNVNRLYADMRSAMAGERWAGSMPSNLIFISGPSKTADIQQTLAYGAHGPKELIVILVAEDVL